MLAEHADAHVAKHVEAYHECLAVIVVVFV
jgi:hypothetical protein